MTGPPRISSRNRALAGAVWFLRLATAAAALVLILLPAEIWSAPAHDLTQSGFDPPTAYVDRDGGRYTFEPFQVLENGTWESCPCSRASHLVLVGSDLASGTHANGEGASSLGGVAVTVDGKPTRVFAVSPTQINFFLRNDVAPPVSEIQLLRNGEIAGTQLIPVAGAGATTTDTSTAILDTERLQLAAAPGGQPSVHLVTSPLSYSASFDVTVHVGDDGQPFQAMIWNPREFGAAVLEFGPAPLRTISWTVSERGVLTQRRDLGSYELGEPTRVSLSIERNESVTATVRSGDAPPASATFTADEAPTLFEAYRPSLTLLSQAGREATDVTVTGYELQLPHERFLSVRADDAKILPIVLTLLGLSLVLHAPLLAGALRHVARLRPPRWRLSAGSLLRWWWAVPGATGLGVAVGMLMPLGSHPFDMGSQQIWTYLLVTDGVGDLYYRAQTVPAAWIWEGMPFHEGVYPYGVAMSYYFLGIGWIHTLFGGEVGPQSSSLPITIKAVSFLVLLADVALIYLLVRKPGRVLTLARTGAHYLWLLIPLAVLLSPALLFDVAVWGETEPVALFFLIASLLAAQRSANKWAWALLAVAFLGKQTVVLPAIIIGLFYLRLFSWRETAEGVAVAMPVVLALIAPYVAAGYPPSVAIDPILGVFQVFGGSEMEQAFQVVSFDAYSIWPLVTLLRHGAHGLERLQFPDSLANVGPLSYHQLGLVAFLAIAGALAVWLLTSRRVAREPGVIFVVLAAVTLAEMLVPTRAIARYLMFPLVFAIIGSGVMPLRSTVLVVCTLTVTSLLGMYGSMASAFATTPELAPQLAPENNLVSSVMLDAFRSDWVITAGSLANCASLLVLSWALLRPVRAARWSPALRQARAAPITEGTVS